MELFTDWDEVLFANRTVEAILEMDLTTEEKVDEAKTALYYGDIDEYSYNFILNKLNL